MLDDYFAIREGRRRPRFREAEASVDPSTGASALEAKAQAARTMMSSCRLCERRCAVDRAGGETGWCGVGAAPRVASEFLHMGEEPELVPSHTIFFAGCTMRCVYCQNWDIAMDASVGGAVDAARLAAWIAERHAEGAANVNLVGGEPTPNLPAVLEALVAVEGDTPIVWNSNMYMSEEAMDLLCGVVDVYLADFRYGNDECARRLSDAPRYFETVARNFIVAFDTAEVMLRHLVLPGHIECCTEPIMRWVAERMPSAYFNLMFQYRPEYRAPEHPEIDRILTPEEKRHAMELARRYGLAVGG